MISAMVRSCNESVPPVGEQRLFVQRWAETTPFQPLRQYRSYSRDDGVACLAAEVEQMPGERIWFAAGDSEPVGLAVLEALEWDSEVFGLRMGRLAALCGEVELASVLSRARELGYEHLAVRVNCADVERQWALAEAGFIQVDTLCSYVHEHGQHVPPGSSSVLIRRARPRDQEAIQDCIDATFSQYPGRYWRDPVLRGRQLALYRRWGAACDGHHVIVSVSDDDRPTGFLVWREWHDPIGNLCWGRGLGAVAHGMGGGTYRAILAHAVAGSPEAGVHHSEFDSQIDNYAVQRLYQSLSFRYVLARSTWHRAL